MTAEEWMREKSANVKMFTYQNENERTNHVLEMCANGYICTRLMGDGTEFSPLTAWFEEGYK